MKQTLCHAVEYIKRTLPKLTKEEVVEIDKMLYNYIETSMMPRASEASFAEWNDHQEDIYNEKATLNI